MARLPEPGQGWWLPAAACMAVAAALRLPGLGTQSLWIDEIYSVAMTRWPLETVVRVQDGHPPLFALLHTVLARWVDVALAGRLIAAAAGVLAVGVMVRFASALWGRRTGVVAGVLLALSPLHVWYSQEGRGYTLVVLIGLGASLALVRATRDASWRAWAIFGLWSLAGLFTHYLYAALLLAQGIFLALQGGQRHLLAALAVIAVIGGACIPVLGPEVTSFIGDQRGFEWLALPYTAFTFVAGFGLGPPVVELHRARGLEVVLAHWPWITAVAVVAIGLLVAAPRALAGAGPWGRYVLLWAIVPVALTFAGSWWRDGAFNVRYAIVALPGLLVGMALVLTAAGSTRLIGGLTALLVLSLASIAYDRLDVAHRREDVRGAAQYLDGHAQPSDRIFVSSRYMDLAIGHYYRGTIRLEPLPIRPVRTSEDASRNLGALQERLEATWLVLVREWEDDPHGQLAMALDGLDGMVVVARFPGVRILRFGTPLRSRAASEAASGHGS